MTEIRHLRCDRCDDDIVIDSRRSLSDTERGWVQVLARDLERHDFCPNCWHAILEFVEHSRTFRGPRE